MTWAPASLKAAFLKWRWYSHLRDKENKCCYLQKYQQLSRPMQRVSLEPWKLLWYHNDSSLLYPVCNVQPKALYHNRWSVTHHTLLIIIQCYYGINFKKLNNRCATKNNYPLKMSHLLIPGTSEYMTLQGKRNFAGVIEVKGFEMGDYSGLAKGTQCNHMSP